MTELDGSGESRLAFLTLYISPAIGATLSFLLLTGYIPLEESLLLATFGFLCLYAMLLTVVKLGVDGATFTHMTTEGTRIDFVGFITKNCARMAVVSCLLVWIIYGLTAAIVSYFVLLLDIYAVACIAALNARCHFLPSASISLLGQPLTLALLPLMAQWAHGFNSLLFALSLSTGVKACAAIVASRQRLKHMPRVKLSLQPWQLLIQQVANALLFRLDQLAVSLTQGLVMLDGRFIREFFLLARFADLCSVLATPIGFAAFPRLRNAFSLRSAGGALFWISIIPMGGLLCGFYLMLGDGPAFSFAAPFFLSALFILPANYMTYMHTTESAMRKMLQALGKSLLAGGCLLALLISTHDNAQYIPWIVTLQLAAYCTLMSKDREHFGKTLA